jgi:SAM-dependent methyltransferase
MWTRTRAGEREQVGLIPPLPEKTASYYEGARIDLLEWLGGRHERVLEVGCGEAGNAPWLRAHGATDLVGVEIHSASAERAREKFDRIEAMPIEQALPLLSGPFDLIVCADVLEHLVDPWDVVRRLGQLAADDGQLLVSVPNIRFLGALVRIAVGVGFRPEPEGIFDATHLRYFTRDNITHLLRQGGWRPDRWAYPPYQSRSPNAMSATLSAVRGGLSRVTLGATDEWLAQQWWIAATRAA